MQFYAARLKFMLIQVILVYDYVLLASGFGQIKSSFGGINVDEEVRAECEQMVMSYSEARVFQTIIWL